MNDADFEASYEETSTTALSANPAVAVPLLTINGWILMQRKVAGGSVSFGQYWAAYRDGFGSAAGNDNYWLGLDKVYRLRQMGIVRLRVEVSDVNETFMSRSRPIFQYFNIFLDQETSSFTRLRPRARLSSLWRHLANTSHYFK